MSQAAYGIEPFSTTVKLWLEYQDPQSQLQRIELAEAGPDFVYARQPRNIPPGSEVLLIISIDDEHFPHYLTLPDGMSKSEPQAAIAQAAVPF